MAQHAPILLAQLTPKQVAHHALKYPGLFKDKKMLQRFIDINGLPSDEKHCIIQTMDHFIKASKVSML